PADFQPAVAYSMPAKAEVWIAQAFADHLWPGEDPLGKEFWMGEFHYRVAGVLAHFARPNPGRSENGVASSEWSVILPVLDAEHSGRYVLRADPAQLPRAMPAVREAVA